MKSEIPLKPGYYRAKWRIPSDDTPATAHACPCDTWEIVQVNPNTVDWQDDPTKLEALSVAVCGVQQDQWRDCFVWGEFIAPLEPKVMKPVKARGHWYNRFLDGQSAIFSLVRALNPIAKEIKEKVDGNLDDSWNADAHVELTLSVGECRAIQRAVKEYGILAERK